MRSAAAGPAARNPAEKSDWKPLLAELHLAALNRAKKEEKISVDLLARLARLAESDAAELARIVHSVGSPQSSRDSTVHAMLWQIAMHNSYHAGQIALLRRQAGAWPPERGGDTW